MLIIDSSMLSAFRSCPRKFELTYLEHWKPQGESVHLVAGKAFASGIEAAREAFYDRGESPDEAVTTGVAALLTAYGPFEPPEGSPKTALRMADALTYYFEQYPLDKDPAKPVTYHGGRRGIEFSFVTPLPIKGPNGIPLLFSGRADMIADFAGGRFLYDEKTTSSLGPSWGRQWDLRSQFTAYCWASAECGLPVNGAVVRGVSILKTKFDTQQVITYRAQWEINRWLEQTLRDIERIFQMAERKMDSGLPFDHNLDHACTEYGGCQFRDVCKSPNPDTWLPMRFERKVWDPVLREEREPTQDDLKWSHHVVG